MVGDHFRTHAGMIRELLPERRRSEIAHIVQKSSPFRAILDETRLSKSIPGLFSELGTINGLGSNTVAAPKNEKGAMVRIINHLDELKRLEHATSLDGHDLET